MPGTVGKLAFSYTFHNARLNYVSQKVVGVSLDGVDLIFTIIQLLFEVKNSQIIKSVRTNHSGSFRLLGRENTTQLSLSRTP